MSIKYIKFFFVYIFMKRKFILCFVFFNMFLLIILNKTHISFIVIIFISLIVTLIIKILLNIIRIVFYVKINEYLNFNRFTHNLHMNINYFKDIDELTDGFMEALQSIPPKFLIKDFSTNTNEIIFLGLKKKLHIEGLKEILIAKDDEFKSFKITQSRRKSHKLLRKIIFEFKDDSKYEIDLHFIKYKILLEKACKYSNIKDYFKDINDIEEKVFTYKVLIPRELLKRLSKVI